MPITNLHLAGNSNGGIAMGKNYTPVTKNGDYVAQFQCQYPIDIEQRESSQDCGIAGITYGLPTTNAQCGDFINEEPITLYETNSYSMNNGGVTLGPAFTSHIAYGNSIYNLYGSNKYMLGPGYIPKSLNGGYQATGYCLYKDSTNLLRTEAQYLDGSISSGRLHVRVYKYDDIT